MALWQPISNSSATHSIWLVRVLSKPISHSNGCHMHILSFIYFIIIYLLYYHFYFIIIYLLYYHLFTLLSFIYFIRSFTLVYYHLFTLLSSTSLYYHLFTLLSFTLLYYNFYFIIIHKISNMIKLMTHWCSYEQYLVLLGLAECSCRPSPLQLPL